MKPNRRNTILYIVAFYLMAISIRYIFVEIKPTFFTNLNIYFQSLLLGISPLIGGYILVKYFHRPYLLRHFNLGVLKTMLLAFLPVFLFSIVSFIQLGQLNFSVVLLISTAVLYGVFEEYGWRGYLQSELNFLPSFYKYFIISILWYIWHLDFGLDFQHLMSYFYVLAGSFGIGYVADKSKTLILPSLFHAFYNILFGSAIIGVTFTNKIAILIVCIAVVIYTMIKQRKSFEISK